MTTFEDGPAKGQKLLLRKAPRFLRVVTENDKWDALDQPFDVPSRTEQIYAYEITGEPGMIHLNAGRGRHGFYVVANYKLVKVQPTDAEMRSRSEWLNWCGYLL